MPVYEYEPEGGADCLICNGRVSTIQGINDPPHTHCPDCGMAVRRVISRVAFKMESGRDADHAAKHGFSTFKRAESGVWEKQAGDGPDTIVRPLEDAPSPAPKPKVWDLDQS